MPVPTPHHHPSSTTALPSHYNNILSLLHTLLTTITLAPLYYPYISHLPSPTIIIPVHLPNYYHHPASPSKRPLLPNPITPSFPLSTTATTNSPSPPQRIPLLPHRDSWCRCNGCLDLKFFFLVFRHIYGPFWVLGKYIMQSGERERERVSLYWLLVLVIQLTKDNVRK